jgi:glycosyltransferase involved in cell wall biosynthesis
MLRAILIGYLIMHNLERLELLLSKKLDELLVIGLVTPNSVGVRSRVTLYMNGIRGKSFSVPLLTIGNRYNVVLATIVYIIQIIFSIMVILRQLKRYHLVLAVTFQSAVIGLLLKKILLTKYMIYYSLDYFYPNPYATLVNRIANRIFIAIDRLCSKNSDIIWNLSAKMGQIRYFCNSDLKVKQLTVPHPIVPRQNSKERSPGGKIGLFFCGWIKKGVGLEVLLDALPTIARLHKDVFAIIVGSGPFLSEIEKKIKEKNLTSIVKLTGFIPEEKVAELAARCMIGLALYPNDLYHYINFTESNKIKRYIELCLPVLTTPSNILANEIKEFEAGLVIGYDSRELALTISQLVNDPSIITKLQYGVRRLARKYSIEKTYGTAWKSSMVYLSKDATSFR